MIVGSALAASLALVGASCTGDDGSIEVIGDDGQDALSLAMDNTFAASSRFLDGAPFDGVALQVEYFEALRKGGWTAPDHCFFSTRVSVNDELVSDGFNGPSSDDDTDAGEGVLAGSVRSMIAGSTEAGSDDTTTTFSAEDDPPPLDPTSEARPVVLAVVAVYGHDQVVELSSSDPSVIEGHGLEAQPVDGWNLLRVALDPERAPVDSVEVTLRRVHQDGTERSEQLSVPLGRPGLELLTDSWRFDLTKVDPTCEVPGGTVENEAPPSDIDVLGSPVGDAPALPAPGAAPADPAAAADQALASLRVVYDIADVYSEGKRDHIENPDEYDKIRTAIEANDVVGPYLSNLDPQFRSSVFVSPTEAHILYKVGPSYQWEIGRVLLIDGKWRVAAGTFCRDLSAAGYTCPGVTRDPAPGPLG